MWEVPHGTEKEQLAGVGHSGHAGVLVVWVFRHYEWRARLHLRGH